MKDFTAETSADRTEVVVGAGPTGLWLASELALAGVHTVVLEKRTEPSPYARALAIMPRTLEILALRDAVQPFLDAGRLVPAWHFGLLEEDVRFDTLDTPFPAVLLLPQTTTEALLETRARELGVVIVDGADVSGVSQDASMVTVTYQQSGVSIEIDAALVVGCDGRRSVVRELAGIPFEGEASTSWGFVGDVVLDSPPAPGTRFARPDGALIVAPLPDGRHRLTGWDPEHQAPDEDLDLQTLRGFAQRMAGTDFGAHDPSWLFRFGNADRLAVTFRSGRVLLAGDAAHMNWPTAGYGLNAGIQDAMALGWRAARFIRGLASDAVLDDYAAERLTHGKALRTSTLTQGALITAADPAALATRATFNRLLATTEGNREIARWLAGLSEETTASAEHVSKNQLVSGHGVGLFTSGRPVLFVSDAQLFPAVRESLDVVSDQIMIRHVVFEAEIPVGPRMVLIRPDGHIAWTKSGAGPVAAELNEALRAVGVGLGAPAKAGG